MTSLVIIGGGRMGEALAAGLVRAHWAEASEIVVVEPSDTRANDLRASIPGIRVMAQPVDAPGAIIAVKPGIVVDVARVLGTFDIPRIVSIAAGVRTATIEAALPEGRSVIRAMPNTPALVGEGATAVAAGSRATSDDLDWAEAALGTIGSVVRVDESQLDAVTGLSGSGPAYIFLMVEALIDGGVLNGLDRATATTLVVQTLRGSAKLLGDTGDPASLRAAVTSPGGTTAAGLAELERAGVRAAILDAVSAATDRSRQLG